VPAAPDHDHPDDSPVHERTLAPSPFPGDDGAPRAEVRDALARFAGSNAPDDYLRAVAVLCADRLLVPVVATATRLGGVVGGLASDKEAEMAVVLLQRSDGGTALLGFTGLDALRTWDSRARPVPVTIDKVAETAVAEGAVAVLVDLAGPHPLVLEGEVLDALARGHRLIDLGDGFGWAMPAPADPPGTPRPPLTVANRGPGPAARVIWLVRE
jgi:hypothetical protein